jgi:TRAP-type uncharacterized transport system substrate-binding protein
MKAKQFLLAVFVLGVGVALAGEAWARNLYSMGTASTAGTYYILGAGFAAHINKRCPTVKVTAEITAGTLQNYSLLNCKKMDFGFRSPDIVPAYRVEKKYGAEPSESP